MKKSAVCSEVKATDRLLRRSLAPLILVLLLTPLKCTKVCSGSSAVFHHLCTADDRQRRRPAARWPAVVSSSRFFPHSNRMREKFQLSLLKVRASLFKTASAATVPAPQRKTSGFSGTGKDESFWQGVKEPCSSSLRSHFDGLFCTGAGQAMLSYVTICGLFTTMMWNTPSNRHIEYQLRDEAQVCDL